MKLLTWNINGRSDTLSDAVAFLDQHAATDEVIGCIQESPDEGIALRSIVERRSTRLTSVPVRAKAQLIYSRTLRLRFARRAKTDRAVVARFKTASGSELYVVGLHFYDRINLEHPEARGGAFALLRANIDEITPGWPVVVLGDFNTEPRNHEITSPFCFYSRSSRDKIVKNHKEITGTLREPFLLTEPTGDGTYYYKRDEGWKMMDFVIFSPELRASFNSIEVQTSLLGKDLLTSSEKRIPKEKHSDHLPVLAELNFQ